MSFYPANEHNIYNRSREINLSTSSPPLLVEVSSLDASHNIFWFVRPIRENRGNDHWVSLLFLGVVFPTMRTIQIFFILLHIKCKKTWKNTVKRIRTGIIEDICNYPKTMGRSVYCYDIRNGEVMCIGQHHIDLVPLESKTGLRENWQNSFATFGVCPEIKWLSLLSVSIQFLFIQLFQYVPIGWVLRTPKVCWIHCI